MLAVSWQRPQTKMQKKRSQDMSGEQYARATNDNSVHKNQVDTHLIEPLRSDILRQIGVWN